MKIIPRIHVNPFIIPLVSLDIIQNAYFLKSIVGHILPSGPTFVNHMWIFLFPRDCTVLTRRKKMQHFDDPELQKQRCQPFPFSILGTSFLVRG